MHKISRHLSYANVAATLALVFAMTGGALAANSYLLTSTSQVSPKVLRKLHGRAGAAGKQGKPGKEGAPGKEGQTGNEGPPGTSFTIATTLQPGQTETGGYEAWTGTKGYFGGAVNFRIPLAAALDEEHVVFNEKATTSEHCAGPGKAASGYLCLYESVAGFANREFGNINRPGDPKGNAGAETTGFGFYLVSTSGSGGWSYGAWAVTG